MKLKAVVILLILYQFAYAQNFKDNIYQSWGFTYFLDVSVSQIKSFTFFDYVPNEDGYLVEREFTGHAQTSSISAITGIYRLRYNVKNFEESALTISVSPALGLSIVDLDAFSEDNSAGLDLDRVGNGQFNLSFLVGYESGLGSKKGLDSKFGWLVKLGYEHTLSPVIYYTKSRGPYQIGAWGQPAFACALRYKNKRNVLREINLKIGHIPANKVPSENADDKLRSPMTIRISFLRQIK